MGEVRISRMASSYPASGIRKMFERATAYPDAIKFTVGEPDFNTPECIVQAAKDSLDAHETRYVSNAGIPELREALAERYSARWGRPLTAQNVLITVGGMEALLVTMQAVVEPGQEVLVPSPGYPNYLGQLHAAGAVPVPVPVTEADGFRLTCAAVEAALTDQTAAILLNSPSNPLGSVMDTDQIRAILALAKQRGLMVISDEVYEEIIFDGRKHVSAGELSDDLDHVIVVNSFSKSFAMTGWRCGWLIGPESLVAVMAHLKEGVTSCVAPFIQRAALTGLSCAQDDTRAMRDAFERRRDLVFAGINAIEGLSL